MINVLGSVGRVGAAIDLVEAQGGLQRLGSAANQALLQALSNRSAVGPLSSLYTGSGGQGPAADPNADGWVFDASLDAKTAVNALDQIKAAGGKVVVYIDSLKAALDGGTAPIRYVITKDVATAQWYAQAGSNAALIDAGSAAGAEPEKKGMSTVGKVVVGGAILAGGFLLVKSLGRPSAAEAPTVRSY